MAFTQSNNEPDTFYSQLMEKLLEESRNGKIHTLEDFMEIAADHYDDIYAPAERDAATRKRYTEVFGKAYLLRFQHCLMTGNTGLLSCVTVPKQETAAIPSSGLPLELQNITIKRIERIDCHASATAHHDKIYSYIRHIKEHIQMGTGLVIFGRANNMKSYYGASIAAAAMSKRNTAFYLDAPVLLNKLIEWERCNTEKYVAVMNQILSASVLILDKLGQEGNSVPLNFKFRQIVLKRYAERRPVVFITALSPKQFMFQYHEDIIKKLQARCRLVFFDAGKQDSAA